jgi:O-antigen/teichoic acid export membrane protein
LKHKVNTFYSKVGIESDRTKKITKHVFISFFYKGGSIISSFLIVPLIINYLNTENYGIWLTLSSFLSWFSFFDIGLGNGLRNKFAEAKAKGNIDLACGYVSSAYFTIGAISFSIFIIFFIFNFFIDWTIIFNTNQTLQSELGYLMLIVFGFFCLQLVVNLITTIYTADQQPSMHGKINFYTQLGTLIIIWVLTKTCESSLFVFGLVFSTIPVVILLLLNWFSFNNKYKSYKPSFSLWKRQHLKDIFGLGFKFFIIQFSGIVLFSTDSLIISNMLSPVHVVPYQMAFKYFSITTMLFSIISTPYWSGFTEAYVNNDKKWIYNSIKTLIKFSVLFIFGCLVLFLCSKWVYEFWLGDKVKIPTSLSILMMVYFIQTLFITPFTIYINGTGKVLIQTIQSIFSALINIPLSIYFIKQFDMGSSGVILATIISLIPSLILAPIQTWKLTIGTNNNLFNK